jgi:hypothetical protein
MGRIFRQEWADIGISSIMIMYLPPLKKEQNLCPNPYK